MFSRKESGQLCREIRADSHTLGLLGAFPEQHQLLVGRQLLGGKLIHQVHVTLGTVGKTGAVFGFALRTEHERQQVYYTQNLSKVLVCSLKGEQTRHCLRFWD
jgi:hypothetical protein